MSFKPGTDRLQRETVEPRVTHYLSGVSYCWDCGLKLVLMDDDQHTTEDCGAWESVSGESGNASARLLVAGILTLIAGSIMVPAIHVFYGLKGAMGA